MKMVLLGHRFNSVFLALFLGVLALLTSLLVFPGATHAANTFAVHPHLGTCTVNSGGGATYTTISDAITDTNCTTINVTGGGPYREAVVINRALILNGPNAGTNPNTQTRNPEVAIQLPAGVSDPNNGDAYDERNGPPNNHAVIVRVLSSNVTIDGFTIDGNDSGNTIAANTGIDNYADPGGSSNANTDSNIVIQNNIIQNISNEGILFEEQPSTTSGNFIENNKINNIPQAGNGDGVGVRLGYNFYAVVSGNTFSTAKRGVFLENYFNANPDAANTGIVTNNNFTNIVDRAIWYNNNYGSSSNTISNNTINGSQYSALSLISVTQDAQVTVSGNNATGGTYGIEVWNSFSSSHPLTISGGTIAGAKYGAYTYNSTFYGFPVGSPTAFTLSGVTINNPITAGVYVNETLGDASKALTATLNGVTITGGQSSASINGQYAFFNPGNAAFNTPAQYYISLLNNDPNNVDGRNAVYDGTTGNNLSTAQFGAIESKIQDSHNGGGPGTVILGHTSYGPTCTVNSGGGANYTTISTAIADTSCTTIQVTGGGPYKEAIVIGRALILQGPNSGISPLVAKGKSVNPKVNPRPNPEVTITLPDGQSDPNDNSNQGTLIRVLASNVTIDGFVLDGANPTTGSGGSPVAGVPYNGVSVNAAYAIENYSANVGGGIPQYVNNITIQNDIIRNFGSLAVDLDFFGQSYAASSGNTVSYNVFDNVAPGNGGRGIYFSNDLYASVTNNRMTNVDIGIQTDNYSQANPGPTTPAFDSNAITATSVGIWYNNKYQNASPYSISNNTITMPTVGSGNNTIGLWLTSLSTSATATVNNNTINGGDTGIAAWNDPTSNTVTINGGSVTNSGYGVRLYDYEPGFDQYGSVANPTTLALSGVNISSPITAGVFVNETIITSTVPTTLNMSGVTITGGPVQALINGQNANFAPSNSNFNTPSQYYIELSNATTPNTPNDVDGTQANYDGVNGTTGTGGNGLTGPQYRAIKAKIIDKDVNAALGRVILTIPNGLKQLTANQSHLTYQAANGATGVLSQKLNLTAPGQVVNYTSTISYSGGASDWLSLNPASGSILAGNTSSIEVKANPANLANGTYTAAITFQDTATSNDAVTVTVTLVIGSGSPLAYSYYLPFVANAANSYTSQVIVQNVGSGPATLSSQYYDASGNSISVQATTCGTLAANVSCKVSNPFASGTQGTGVIVSNQPLSVLVQETTPFGSSAYAVQAGASANLVAPLAINNAGGFVTSLTVANAGASATEATVTYYDQNGNALPTATRNLNLNAHSSQTLDQSSTDSRLPSGFYGWAQITGTNGAQLVAQVLETRADIKFVALANAQNSSQSSFSGNQSHYNTHLHPRTDGVNSYLYAPALFKAAFGGFVTGANIVNPNTTPVSISVTYYDNTGKAWTTTPFTLAGHAVAPIYQGANSGNGIPVGGLPDNFYGSAVISSQGGTVVMVVNEAASSPTTQGTARSGTYAAASTPASSIGLPIVANGGNGYTTGATVWNTAPNTQTVTITYYNQDGTQAGQPQSYQIAAHASLPVYQGAASLPQGFYGSAMVSGGNNNLLVTTNAQSSNLFFTYTSN